MVRSKSTEPVQLTTEPVHFGAVAVRSGAEPETLVEGPAATRAARAQRGPLWGRSPSARVVAGPGTKGRGFGGTRTATVQSESVRE